MCRSRYRRRAATEGPDGADPQERSGSPTRPALLVRFRILTVLREKLAALFGRHFREGLEHRVVPLL